MLQRTNSYFWYASVIGLFAALVTVLVLYSFYETIEKKATTQISLNLLADELRQSSDDLTRFARSYAATQDTQYKEYYQSVLNIRNGKKEIPQNYDYVYWDLKQVGMLGGEKMNVAKPILQRMKEIGMDSFMLEALRKSKSRSDRLVDMERTAFMLIENGNPNDAIQMLFSLDYHKAKAQIMAPIREFQLHVEAVTKRDLDIALQEARKILQISVILIAMSLILSCLAWIYRKYKIVDIP